MLATLSVFWAVAHYGGPMYKEWAEGQCNKIKGILNSAREGHTQAVKERIENVKQLGSVIEVTKQLFEVSKVDFGNDPLVLLRSLIRPRKPHNSRLKRLSLSKGPPLPRRQSRYSTHGCGMRGR